MRHYLINSWVGCRESNRLDQYSGEQLGNRQLASVGKTIHRKYDITDWEDIPTYVNGKACVANFSEENIQKWLNPQEEVEETKPSVYRMPECVLPGEEEVDTYDVQQLALVRAYRCGDITKDIYDANIKSLREKQIKAWDKYVSQSNQGLLDKQLKSRRGIRLLALMAICAVAWILFVNLAMK